MWKELPEYILKKKKSGGFDDEIVLCGLASDVVKYKDGKETEKEKSESTANVLWRRLRGKWMLFSSRLECLA